MTEIVEVSGESCANCFTLLPVVRKLAAERSVPFRHIEVEKGNEEEIRRLEIERVPTVLVVRDGVPVARCTGYQPEEILEVWLDAKLEDIREIKR